MEGSTKVSRAIFGGGCFWCVEAAYRRVPGVLAVTSGYSGGDRKKPSYEEVCTGLTGHAEVVAVDFNPAETSYEDLLETFWKVHDPTTQDRQGADVGTQYRSVIFCSDEAQLEAAKASKLRAEGRFEDPIVTEILPAGEFWPAEAYHKDYYELHPSAGYCRAVIAPKLAKAGFSAQPLGGV